MEIQVELSRRCALACTHCSNVSDDAGKPSFLVEDLVRLCQGIIGPLRVILTGGEPLECSELTSIVRVLASIRQNLSVGIFTSGVCFRATGPSALALDDASVLASAGLARASFSVYNTSESKHDEMTGVPGSLAMTMESARVLAGFGVELQAHVVILQTNISELGNLVSVLGGLGFAEVRFLRLQKRGRAARNWASLAPNEQVVGTQLSDLMAGHRTTSVRVSLGGFPTLAPCRPHPNAIGCQAGATLLYVNAYGDVFPCACLGIDARWRIAHISATQSILDYHSGARLRHLEECPTQSQITGVT